MSIDYVVPVLERYFSTDKILDNFGGTITYGNIYLRRPLGPFWTGFHFNHFDVAFNGENPVHIRGYIPRYVPKPKLNIKPGPIEEDIEEELSYDTIEDRSESEEVPENIEVDLTGYFNLKISVTTG